ncbi:hypothetical protein [Salinivibrio sp. VYel4]|uniref:hypothetical protein n=1 Tax=Salinivibrio sp. VYel4 TaxID=2490491 RepID=UPI00128BA8EC|nr:hypothetical protein [Salinivibrio sp. VYel4]MPY01331.1 hypothetical protein [Salinivibrio sp. VYel4]
MKWLLVFFTMFSLCAFSYASLPENDASKTILVKKVEVSEKVINKNHKLDDSVSDKYNWATWNNIASLGTFISALATLVIAGLTFSSSKHAKMSAIAAEKSADAANNSVKIAKDAYIASERPWISVSPQISSDLTKNAGSINVPIHFKVKNYGNSPALNVCVFYEVVTLKVAQDQYSGSRERTDKLGESGLDENMGIQLFPSQEAIIPWCTTLTADEIEKGHNKWSRENNMLPSFSLIGSVFYRSVFDDQIYKTGFKYDVLALDVVNSSLSCVPNFVHSFPKNKLAIQQSSFYKGTIS